MTSDRASSTVPALEPPAVRAASDAYRASMARSIGAARRHDQLTQRLHAAQSARYLVRLLFALEEQEPPTIDALPDALAGIEETQDWPAGYLRWALLNLVRDPAPPRQLELARRVERLLAARGIGTAQDDAPTPAAAVGWELTSGGLRRAP